MKHASVFLVLTIVVVIAAAAVSGRQLTNPVVVRAGDIVIAGGRLFDGVRDPAVRGQFYDAPSLLESVKGRPATAADDDPWKGNKRFPSGRGSGQ